jgi:hypothetical protein
VDIKFPGRGGILYPLPKYTYKECNIYAFGLRHRVTSPRIEIATEPYPNRWTHHLLISRLEEIDEELMSWIQEAALFAASKS